MEFLAIVPEAKRLKDNLQKQNDYDDVNSKHHVLLF